ncbi:MexE family multidrug efflux RND transporter periplasmic adaptor subunit [Azorhizobium oxalatiphilum]|uniref:MexE family multidrug efflux RND transporter periplasmic adaptor subunit n=1 Tax=Azorhizobium oxalatiphilum TaxID=980631 RepID=A0A917FK25_9HYPH|nr:efflux RND transporter periplasmic adaptor subunit [Azorhizobium oxalatiphilum]GGF84899.1 MexE family multidrug efflux RND transporter periplasmic adaptor subunit [Azorhizobium oxalatiphilum]
MALTLSPAGFSRTAALVFALAAAPLGTALAQQGGPPPAVGIVTAQPEPIVFANELPGRIAPTRIAEVVPRITGIILERVFVQGTMVKEGDVLYRIDPAPFEVRVASAKATLQRAHATQLQARQQNDRQKELRDRNVNSAQALDNAVAALAQADADVAAAEAGLAEAELNLRYASVTAPISGRIGRATITEGALVSSSSGSLATIQRLDPVYADFTQSATEMLRLRRALKDGTLQEVAPDEARVHLIMEDGTRYPLPGKLLFSEATVEPSTGQVILRGEFPNPNGDLLPGMYVRVEIEQGVQKDALAVPTQAVQRDTAGTAQLFIVKADDTIERRNVTAGRVVGERWVIDANLKPGERVVVDGFQKIGPGAKVTPQPWKPAAKDAGAGNPDAAKSAN